MAYDHLTTRLSSSRSLSRSLSGAHRGSAAGSDGEPESPFAGEPAGDEVGPPVVEVRTWFRGVQTGARVLPTPTAAARPQAAAFFLLGGGLCAALAVALFVAAAADAGAERRAFAGWLEAGHSADAFAWRPRGIVPDLLFAVALLAGGALTVAGLRRRATARAGFLVGWGAGVDAPLDPRFLADADADDPAAAPPAPRTRLVPARDVHPLVVVAGDRYLVNVPARMAGELTLDGLHDPLAAQREPRDAPLALPAGATWRLTGGETTFLVSSTAPPPRLPAPLFAGRGRDQAYTAGVGVGLGLFVLMLHTVPADAGVLGIDRFDSDRRFMSFRIAPPEAPPSLAVPGGVRDAAAAPGAAGRRHAGEAGQAGKPVPLPKSGRAGFARREEPGDLRLAKAEAAGAAARAGVLGVLAQRQSDVVASIFAADDPLGADARNALGNLVANEIGAGYGVGGIGATGTGSGGGGTGEGTLGLGGLKTIGRFGGDDRGFGRGGCEPGRPGGCVGRLGTRRTRGPDFIDSAASVRGSLDKEIVRRIVRRHLNEVKYCYEQELAKNAALSGRLLVQFTISGAGQVLSSALTESTVHNARVESCTVQAVRRWAFPQPLGGGIVIVTYPFVLAPAGGAGG